MITCRKRGKSHDLAGLVKPTRASHLAYSVHCMKLTSRAKPPLCHYIPPLAHRIMASQSSIRTLFATIRLQRSALEAGLEPSNITYQETLQAAIASLEECRQLAERLSLFSPNETEDDIASGDLQ